MKCVRLFAVSLLICRSAFPQSFDHLLTSRETHPVILEAGFKNPPPQSKLRCWWWWLNSMATKASITRDLEEMKKQGYGGASLVDAGSSSYDVARKTAAGPVFMSNGWMELYKHAIREADRLGIELSVNVQSGWNPGGPTITPALSQKKIVYSITRIKGGSTITVKLPQPDSLLIYQDILVQAFPAPPPGAPVKDSAISNWSLKTFNQSFGFKGTYPLYKLREQKNDTLQNKAIKQTDIIDLSNNLKDDKLTWKAPAGEWIVVRYGWTSTGAKTSTTSDGWNGLSLDHMDPKAFNKFADDVILPLINTAKAAGNSLKYLQTDSWEMGNIGWTANFASEFKRFRQYDIKLWMPVLAGFVVENTNLSNRFLHDYRKTVGDCIATNHYQLFSNLAHEHGLGIHPESGGPHSAPVDALRILAINEIPQGEFWATANTHRIKDDERLAIKQSASVAHTNGKRYVAAEGPTSIGPQWERSPGDLKSNIDRVFCSGLNRIVWHTFTSSPPEYGMPGNEYFAGTHLNPNVTWWKESGSFINYLNRSSYLLAQGLFVADALYYYGDDVPNFVFLKEEVKGLGQGYDWDKCSREVLLQQASVSNGQLMLQDGMCYRVLVLPDESQIDAVLLQKIEKLVQDGLTVIGPRPKSANSLTGFGVNDQVVAAIASKLWGPVSDGKIIDRQYGLGRVVWGKSTREVLESMKVLPDFTFKGTNNETALEYIHRTGDSMDIYFVTNRFGRIGFNDFQFRYLTDLPDRYELAECGFRVSGMRPELWDPMTGTITPVPIYHEENGITYLPLHFEPEGSMFVVFRKQAPTPHIMSVKKDGRNLFPGNAFRETWRPPIHVTGSQARLSAMIMQPGEYSFVWSDSSRTSISAEKKPDTLLLKGSWNLSFDTAWGGPSSVTTDSLRSWTSFDEEGIKYYSGSTVYRKKFNYKTKPDTRMILDLGNVLELASIRVNGKNMPAKWSAPFEFEVTAYLRDGENNLEITVTNLWPNRLIGDSKLPAGKRRTKTNITKFDAPDSEKFLRKSGLLGPVKIYTYPVITTKP